MTEDEMKVAEKALETAEKACHEASKWLLNLSLAIKTLPRLKPRSSEDG
jgi:hypothetical protein